MVITKVKFEIIENLELQLMEIRMLNSDFQLVIEFFIVHDQEKLFKQSTHNSESRKKDPFRLSVRIFRPKPDVEVGLTFLFTRIPFQKRETRGIYQVMER